MMNNGTNRMNSQGLKFDNFKSYESNEPMNLTQEEDIPHVLNVQEIDDETGSHLLVKFDDGSMITTHTHGCLKEDYNECRLIIDKLKPNWIIIDHYSLDHRWQKPMKNSGYKIFVIINYD